MFGAGGNVEKDLWELLGLPLGDTAAAVALLERQRDERRISRGPTDVVRIIVSDQIGQRLAYA